MIRPRHADEGIEVAQLGRCTTIALVAVGIAAVEMVYTISTEIDAGPDYRPHPPNYYDRRIQPPDLAGATRRNRD